MRTTVVPAQVTTVEDKIAGNLGFTQLLLLTTPVFLSGAIFAFVPPFMNFTSYKLVVCVLLAIICLTLAVRIKGKILLTWVSVISRYNIRPRHHVFNKNDLHLRTEPTGKDDYLAEDPETKYVDNPITYENIALPEMVRLENVVSDPRAKLQFRATKKGGLRVYIQEIK